MTDILITQQPTLTGDQALHPYSVTLFASPSLFFMASAGFHRVTIDAYVVDTYGNPMVNQSVVPTVLAASVNSSAVNFFFTAQTDVEGHTSFGVSSSVAQTVIIRATSGSAFANIFLTFTGSATTLIVNNPASPAPFFLDDRPSSLIPGLHQVYFTYITTRGETGPSPVANVTVPAINSYDNPVSGPTVSASNTPGQLQPGIYAVGYTYRTPNGGETLMSPTTNITIAVGQSISVGPAPAPTVNNPSVDPIIPQIGWYISKYPDIGTGASNRMMRLVSVEVNAATLIKYQARDNYGAGMPYNQAPPAINTSGIPKTIGINPITLPPDAIGVRFYMQSPDMLAPRLLQNETDTYAGAGQYAISASSSISTEQFDSTHETTGQDITRIVAEPPLTSQQLIQPSRNNTTHVGVPEITAPATDQAGNVDTVSVVGWCNFTPTFAVEFPYPNIAQPTVTPTYAYDLIQLQYAVPFAGHSGTVTVTVPGTGYTKSTFPFVITPDPAQLISGPAPASAHLIDPSQPIPYYGSISAQINQVVEISVPGIGGNGSQYANLVTFTGGVATTLLFDAGADAISDQCILVAIPPGALTGPVTVSFGEGLDATTPETLTITGTAALVPLDTSTSGLNQPDIYANGLEFGAFAYVDATYTVLPTISNPGGSTTTGKMSGQLVSFQLPGGSPVTDTSKSDPLAVGTNASDDYGRTDVAVSTTTAGNTPQSLIITAGSSVDNDGPYTIELDMASPIKSSEALSGSILAHVFQASSSPNGPYNPGVPNTNGIFLFNIADIYGNVAGTVGFLAPPSMNVTVQGVNPGSAVAISGGYPIQPTVNQIGFQLLFENAGVDLVTVSAGAGQNPLIVARFITITLPAALPTPRDGFMGYIWTSLSGPFANGTDSVPILIHVTDQFQNPIQGASVTIASTGSGNSITQPATTTDWDGTAVAFMKSTVAETKSISCLVNGQTGITNLSLQFH